MGFLVAGCLPAHAQDTVRVTDFGYQPNSRVNAVAYVKQALAACKTKAHPVLVFAPGRYDFWPQYSDERQYFESNTDVIPLRRCPILILQQQNLTIDGQGSDFIYHDREQPFTIDSSMGVTLKNVNIDWDIPLTAQAEVVEATGSYIDLAINTAESPYVIENGKVVFTGEGWKSQWWDAMEFDGTTHLIVPNTADGCLGDGFDGYTAVKLNNGLVRLKYAFKRLPAVGNYLVLRHSARDHAGIFINRSVNTRIEHVNIYHTAGLGILSQYAENLYFKDVWCVPNAAKNRYFCGHDDGLHFSNCKGQIEVDSCRFAALMDDPINVHGTAVQVIKKISPSKLLCKFMHNQSIGFYWAQKGDSIGLIENETMATIGYAVADQFTKLDSVLFELSFSAPLPEALQVGNALENLTWTPAVHIQNSYFGSNRARGILVTTPRKVVIENNVFETSGSAILIAGDANGWFESGAVNDVLISNNTFKPACLTSIYQFCEGIISIYPEIPKLDAQKPFHRNITITHNTFNPFDYPVLYAKSTQGLYFTNNIIIHSTQFTPFHPRKSMITLQACTHVTITGNQIGTDVLGKNIMLVDTPVTEVKLDKKQRIVVE